jgi:predicted DNA-binding protein
MTVVNPTGYTLPVKTAISLPDALYHRAERVAQRLGRTRSALYAEALEAYLDATEDADEVTAALDEVYLDAGAETPRRLGAAAGRRLIDSGQWDW